MFLFRRCDRAEVSRSVKSMERGLSSELRVKEYLCVRGTFGVAEGPGKVQVLTIEWEEIGTCRSLY